MAANRLKERVNGIFIILDLINSFIYAMNGDLIPRNSVGAPSNNSQNFGTTTYRIKDVYLKDKLYVGPEDADGYLKVDEDNTLNGFFDDVSVFKIGAGYFDNLTGGAQPGNTGFSALQTFGAISSYTHINGTGEPIDASFPVFSGEAKFQSGTILMMCADDGSHGAFFGGDGITSAAQAKVRISKNAIDEHAYSCQSSDNPSAIYLPPGAIFQLIEFGGVPIEFGLQFVQQAILGGVRQRMYFHNIEIIAGHVN